MKNIFNISPFILLLFPVFFMVILAFTSSTNRPDQASETAAKITANTNSLDKTSISITK